MLLSECHFDNYGGLPAGSRERDRIARLLLREINGRFPDASLLRGVSGFWEDRQGYHLWKPKDHLLPRLLVPVRAGSGRIQACQMRLPFTTNKGLRYLWVSSSDLIHGTSPDSPLHFSFRFADLPRYARIVIVENTLKADVLFAIRPELYIVATRCVTANHAELVELSRGRPVWIGFDQDHYSNEACCFHLAALIVRRLVKHTWITYAGECRRFTGQSGKSFGGGSPAWNAPQYILRLFGVGAVARYKVSNDGELKANLSR
jgi:hypothetical protein